jgi:hypothetical protein
MRTFVILSDLLLLDARPMYTHSQMLMRMIFNDIQSFTCRSLSLTCDLGLVLLITIHSA